MTGTWSTSRKRHFCVNITSKFVWVHISQIFVVILVIKHWAEATKSCLWFDELTSKPSWFIKKQEVPKKFENTTFKKQTIPFSKATPPFRHPYSRIVEIKTGPLLKEIALKLRLVFLFFRRFAAYVAIRIFLRACLNEHSGAILGRRDLMTSLGDQESADRLGVWKHSFHIAIMTAFIFLWKAQVFIHSVHFPACQGVQRVAHRN